MMCEKTNQVFRWADTRTVLGKPITAEVTLLPKGVQVLITGGDLPHIGAVAIVHPDGSFQVTEFPAHREGVVCQAWAEFFSAAGICPGVISAGIHYDDLDAQGIQDVLEASCQLCDAVIHAWQTPRKG